MCSHCHWDQQWLSPWSHSQELFLSLNQSLDRAGQVLSLPSPSPQSQLQPGHYLAFSSRSWPFTHPGQNTHPSGHCHNWQRTQASDFLVLTSRQRGWNSCWFLDFVLIEGETCPESSSKSWTPYAFKRNGVSVSNGREKAERIRQHDYDHQGETGGQWCHQFPSTALQRDDPTDSPAPAWSTALCRHPGHVRRWKWAGFTGGDGQYWPFVTCISSFLNYLQNC